MVSDAVATGDTVGGDMVAVPLLMAGGFALSTLYGAGQTIEGIRYWNDYYRNTGVRPRYPFRAGVYDGIRNLGSAFYGAGGAYGAYRAWRGTQYKSDRTYNPYEYGMYW